MSPRKSTFDEIVFLFNSTYFQFIFTKKSIIIFLDGGTSITGRVKISRPSTRDIFTGGYILAVIFVPGGTI